jgi:hypothetical protein
VKLRISGPVITGAYVTIPTSGTVPLIIYDQLRDVELGTARVTRTTEGITATCDVDLSGWGARQFIRQYSGFSAAWRLSTGELASVSLAPHTTPGIAPFIQVEELSAPEPPQLVHNPHALLGKRVRVKLDDHVVQEGVLLGFGDGGDVELEGSDGLVYHCWPRLNIEEASEAQSPAGRRAVWKQSDASASSAGARKHEEGERK